MQNHKFCLEAVMEKSGEMIYFSQLDLSRILERALRRTDLPLYYTQGFRPRVKLSFANALKLGLIGNEDVILYFSQKISPQELLAKLTPQLPKGLTILNVKEL